MAVIPAVTTFPEDSAIQVQWVGVTEADTFGATKVGIRYPIRAVEVEGTFGSATVLIQGSQAGVTYSTLNSSAGALSFTSAGLKAVLENAPYLRPSHSGGTGETITVTFTGSAQH